MFKDLDTSCRTDCESSASSHLCQKVSGCTVFIGNLKEFKGEELAWMTDRSWWMTCLVLFLASARLEQVSGDQ